MARKKASATPASASCVLYDPADGRIVHTHTVVRVDGKSVPSPKQLETEARASLAKQPMRPQGLHALPVKPEDLERDGDFRVDVKAAWLEKLPERKRPSKV